MNADRLAPIYRWIEYAAFGHLLETCRFFFLPHLRSAGRILILGEGDGRFLAQLLRVNCHAAIDIVETSQAMIARARARIPAQDTARVTFHAFPPDLPYDAIVTHFFLDCLTPAEARDLIGTVNSTPTATWIVSEFHIPPKGWPRFHAQCWIAAMYAFFRWTTGLRVRAIPPYEAMLAAQGFLRLETNTWRWGLVKAERYYKHLTSPSPPSSAATGPEPQRP